MIESTVQQSDHIKDAIALRNKRGILPKVIDWVRTKPEGGITILFILVQAACIIAAIINPSDFRYLSEPNLAVLLKSIAPIGIMALGVGVLMIAGEFDLSVGFVYSFCAIVAATVSNALGGDVDAANASAIAPFIGLLVGLAIGACAGLINGLITLFLKIPSFITTLGAMLVWKGATLLFHGASSLRFKPSEPFNTLFNGSIGLVHASIIWFVLLSIVFFFLLHHHKIGNHFYAVGGNRTAAVAIGINSVRTKLVAFAITGFMAALSGIIAGARVSSIQPGGGMGLELIAIAACVIGGHALMGGRGSILGVFLGASLMFTIQDVLLLLGAPGFVFEMFVGALIVVSVVINMAIRRTKA